MELLEGIAEAFESHGESQCDALANRLDELVAADQEALAALAESDANKEARKRSAKYQTRIDRAFGTIVEHAPKCGAEPRVAKVLEKLM